METRRVVITGLGAVTPLGNNVASFWQGLKEGRNGIAPITKVDVSDSPIKLAGEVKGFDPRDFMDFKSAKRMELFSQYAVAATREALQDSGLDLTREDPFRMGVIVGCGGGVIVICASHGLEPLSSCMSQNVLSACPGVASKTIQPTPSK